MSEPSAGDTRCARCGHSLREHRIPLGCDHECERDDGYERSEDSYPDDESPFGGASPTEETR